MVACCVAPCKCYVGIASCLTIFTGVLLFLVLGVMIAWDPIASGNFGAISEFAIVEMYLGASVLFMLVAGCVGCAFTRSLGRCTGCIYLLLLLAALVAQFYSAGHIFASSQRLNELTDLYDENATNLDSDHALIVDARKRTMQNTWENFRSSVESYQCNFTADGSLPALNVLQFNSVPLAEMVELDSTPARALQEWEISVPERCTPADKPVECTASTPFQRFYNGFCLGTSAEDGEFQTQCGACTNTYVDLWFNDSDNVADVRRDFVSDTGIMYCRCLTAFFARTQRNSQMLSILIAVYLVFNVFLIFAVICLLIAGPPPVDPGEENFVNNPGASGSQYGGEELPPFNKNGEMLVLVQCPYDSGPGGWVLVTAANGKSAEVIVPPTVGPGMLFQVYI